MCLLFNISKGQPFTLTVQPTNPTCDFSNGYIIASGTGGVTPYVYSCTGLPNQNTGLFTQLGAGNYTISVTDASGASQTQVVALTSAFKHPNTPTVSSSTPPTGCTSDGSLSIATSGGAPPYTYSIDGSTFINSQNFFNLYPGTYNLYVKDANACTVSSRFNLADNCGFVSQPVSTPSSCNNDGTITITPIGSGTYQYSKDGGRTFQNSPRFVDLAGGGYTIVVKDMNSGQESRLSVAVPKICPLDISSTSVAAGCAGNAGQITITVANASPPFFYWIDNGSVVQSNQITNHFIGLTPGVHTANVKTASGLYASQQITVASTAAPSLVATSKYIGCGPTGGAISAVATGGTSPYTFAINAGPNQNNGDFTSLGGGNYIVSVKDNNGCIAEQNIAVTPINGPTLVTASSFAGCSPDGGTISASASGGSEPYSYSLNSSLPVENGLFTNLIGGTYQVNVTDNNGCSSQNSVVITPIIGPVISLTTTKTQCTSNTGSITVNITGGAAPFEYQIENNPEQTTGMFKSLGPGIYSLQVKDKNGCIAIDTGIIETTSAPTLSLTENNTTCAGNDGEIQAKSTGGILPVTYKLDQDEPQANSTFTKVRNGAHNITATDANGCAATKTITVGIINDITVNAGPDKSVCKGDSTVLTGTSNAPTIWTPALNLTDPTNKLISVSPDTTTTYILTATKGVCTAFDSITVLIEPLPTADAGRDTTVCYGTSATLHGSGGISYSWTPSSNLDNDHLATATASNLTETTVYELSVKDINGCTSHLTDEVIISVTPALKLSAGNDTTTIVSVPVKLHAIDVNNSGFISYSWSPSLGLDNSTLQDPTATLTQSQTYVVKAATSQGCLGTDSINIKVFKEANIFVPNAFTPNNDGVNDILRIIPIGIKEIRFFIIYNRFGQRVFSSNNSSNGWDGRINGVPQNTGGYVWIAEAVDYKGEILKRQGTIVLIQ